jgi:3'-5' exoribonuclease
MRVKQFEGDKINLSEIAVEDRVFGNLLVLEAARKKARNGNYAQLTLGDGMKQIQAKRWQYEGELPIVGMVINVEADVGEFKGVKDLNIQKWFAGTIGAEKFKRPGTEDPEALWQEIANLINDVPQPRYRAFGLYIWSLYKDDMLETPAAVKMHHHYESGYLIHTREVMLGTMGLCRAMERSGIYINEGLALVGAALHDLGKVRGYAMEGQAPIMTEEGKFAEHIALGIKMLAVCTDNYCKQNEDVSREAQLLEHIILSHHGELEWGSPVKPCFPEAMLVSMADNASAKIAHMADVQKQTDGDWSEKDYMVGTRIFCGEY